MRRSLSGIRTRLLPGEVMPWPFDMPHAAGPLIEIAVAARTRAEHEKLSPALASFAAAVSSSRVDVDHGNGRIAIRGDSEPHLEDIVDRARRELGIDIDVGAPRVCYRETITQTAEIDHSWQKQTGGSGQYARIKLRFEPAGPGEGYAFDSEIAGGALPGKYVAGVASGLEEARATGVLAGHPVIDFKVTLTDGAYHDVDSSVPVFEAAARAAFREGMMKAAPCLLEPVMKVEIVTSGEYLGDIVTDLKGRRGDIIAIAEGDDGRAITAVVPLADMLGYARTIGLLSRGHARFVMRFSHYAPIPPPDDAPFRPAVGMRA